MNLENLKQLSNNTDTFAIETFKNEFKSLVDTIELLEVIEISYRGNYNLDMVFSLDKKQAVELFLLKTFDVLKYEASEELGYYNFEEYSYTKMFEELSFPDTKKALIKNNVLEKKGNSIVKLKEKDELTFLVETPYNYVFISEFYWKS